MNFLFLFAFLSAINCSPFSSQLTLENDEERSRDLSSNERPHFQGEDFVPIQYVSDENLNPLLLKRTKRKGIKFGGLRKGKNKSPKPGKPGPKNEPYPKQPGSSSYPKQPGGGYGTRPGYGYPGYGVPAGGLSKPGVNPFKQYPKLRGGYGKSPLGRVLGKGGTGKTLGAALIGAGVGYFAAKAIGKLIALPFKLAMYNMYRPNNWHFDHHHDHYHDAHNHYLEADGVYYDHQGNRYVHDAHIHVENYERIAPVNISEQQKNITLVRYYPYNETHGLFEYSNQSTIYSYLPPPDVNSSELTTGMLSLLFTTILIAITFGT